MQARLIAELVRAATELHARRLWERIEPDAFFVVHLPGGEDPLAAAVMGHDGRDYGIVFTSGPDALEQLLRVLGAQSQGGLDLLDCELLSVTVDRWSSLPRRFQEWLQRGRVKSRREKLVPFVGVRRPGGDVLHPPSASDTRKLLASVRAIVDADRAGELTPRPLRSARSRVLVLKVTGEGERPGWKVHFEQLGPKAARNLTDPPRREPPRLADLTSIEPTIELDPDLAWFAGCHVAAINSDGVSDQVDLAFVADDEGSILLASDPIRSGDAAGILAVLRSAIANSSEAYGRPVAPGTITFADPVTFDLAAEAFRAFGATARLAPPSKDVTELLDEMSAHLEVVTSVLAQLPPDDVESWKARERAVIARYIEPCAREIGPRALQRFFGGTDEARDAFAGYSPGAVEPSLITWFFLDFRANRHSRTRCEKLLAKRGLEAIDRSILEAYEDSRLSLYRVEAVVPGESIDVEDILFGGQYEVQDAALSGGARVGMVLPLRLVRLGEWLVPIISGPVVGPAQTARLLATLGDAGLDTDPKSVRAIAHLFGRLWLDARRGSPTLQTTDGDPREALVARFHCDDPAATEAALVADENVVDEGGGHFVWLDDAVQGDGGQIVLGRLDLIGAELVVEVMSRRRLERAKVWLERSAGARFEGAGPPVTAPDDVQLERGFMVEDAEADLSAVVEQLLERQYLEQLEQPIPALGSQSPRQLVRTAEGRIVVERWIRALPTVGTPHGPVEPPREKLRRALGLP
ncbi:DUF7309 domain-containing protein [Engelhardtia mirabilis]|uniref:DUF7309 domain-containing protein n=1 Tax=Engelhardtia mirabilis TaxID=2528011 RepID=A0A518BE68_9BACT|nr:hypothetical protein Pla133_03440 [Planctomycetes bacterium Pla133]QDU99606.1 hypothetical protein Pla86_03440 [Planctomycetes bacterium Pla86]